MKRAAADDDLTASMKVVGRRRWGRGLVATVPLLRLERGGETID